MTLTQVEARALDSSGSGRRRMGDPRSTGIDRPAAAPGRAGTPGEYAAGWQSGTFYGLGRQDVIIDSAPPDSAQSTLSIQSEPAFGTSCHASTLHNRFDVSVTYAF